MVAITLELAGRTREDEIPQIAVYLLDENKKPIKKIATIKDNKLALEPSIEKEKKKVLAIGPDIEDLEEITPDNVAQFKIEEYWPIWMRDKKLVIPKDLWKRWIFSRICLSGRVVKCSLIVRGALFPSLPPHPPAPFVPIPRCAPVCEGVVEIYEQECCRKPWILPDIDLIRKKIREILESRYYPPIKWPQPPPPDPRIIPEPYSELSLDRYERRRIKEAEALATSAAEEEPLDHLVQDLKELETLPQSESIKYVQLRPHLWHFWLSCRTRKIGEVLLGPDGHYSFCYSKIPSIFRRNCWTRYYYKVRQWHENQWVYIYNGVVARRYYTSDIHAELWTWTGRACEGPGLDVENDKPYVALQDIGSTPSWTLVSHWRGKDATGTDLTQTGDSQVSVPIPGTGGLQNQTATGASTGTEPEPDPPNTSLVNRPWGEILPLRIHFSPEMKGIGACYFRVSIVKAGTDGKPDGIPRYLVQPLSWLKFIRVGAHVAVAGEKLGPFTKNGETGLFRIPYRADADWLDGQFHAQWDTREYTNGHYFVVLEVCDKDGHLLTPGSFDYLRWLEETGPGSTAKVPYTKLIHLFWIDNTPCYADIFDIRKNSMPSTEECQFITGTAADHLSVGYRAFHSTRNPSPVLPPKTFMWYYRLWYHRGLNGPNQHIQYGTTNAPATLVAGPPAESTPQSFGDMLGAHTRCAFSLNLRVYARHTNGSRRLDEYDREDQVAFALERS
jgi:hypothetical protein